MANIGSLVVVLEANIARYQADMARAAQQTTQDMKRISGAATVAQQALAALGIGAGIGILAGLVKDSIDAADNLRDMSQKTGIAVETLNGLGFAAGQAGGSLESMVAGAGKLNKSIAQAATGNKDTAAAFDALGISVFDSSGKLKKADVVIAEIADKFQKYQDGPEKSAIALALFSKAGADMIPMLNDGGDALRDNIEYAKKYSNSTTELSDASDNFNDSLGKLNVQQKGFSNALAAELLPTLQSVVNAFIGAAEKSEGFRSWAVRTGDAVKLLTGITVSGAWAFESYGIKLATLAAKTVALSKLDFKSIKLIDKISVNDLADGYDKYKTFREEIRNGPAATSKFDKIFNGLEKSIADEQELLSTRNQMLDKYNGENLISGKDFNSAKAAALKDSTTNTKAFLDQQIAVLKVAKTFAKTDDASDEMQSRIDGLYKKKLMVGIEKQRAPLLPPAAGTADDPTKKLFSGTLKSLEDGLAKEQSALAFGNKYMAELRAQDQIDLDMYNDYRQKSLDSGLAIAVKNYDEGIAAAKAYQAQAKTLVEKTDAQIKIDSLIAKKDKEVAEAGQAGLMLKLDLSKAQSDLNKTIEDWGRQQTQVNSQQQFENTLLGKSTLEVAKLTAQRRIELDIEEKIRQAREKGSISAASVEQFRLDGKDQVTKVNKASTQSVGKQIGESLRRPEQVENEQYANRLKDLEAFRDNELENTVEGNRLIEEETRRHEDAMANMKAQSAQSMLSLAQSSADNLYSALQAAGMEQTALGQAMFFAQKAIQVATIIVNTEVAAAAAQAGMIAAAGATAAVSGPAGPAILAAGVAAGAAYATATRVMGYATAGLVAGTALAGAREKGGPVWSGGAFLVGEKGPEVFQPTSHGTIIPNSKLGGGSGGDVKWTVVNTGTPLRIKETQRVSDGEWALIVEDAVSSVAAQMADPNSKVSRGMGRNFNTQRSRG